MLLALALALAIGIAAYQGFETLSFEPTSGAQFKEWTYEAYGHASGAGITVTALAAVAFVLLLIIRPRYVLVPPIVAIVLIVVFFGLAGMSRERRRHPIAKERAIARSIPLPDAWGKGKLTVLNEDDDSLDPDPPGVRRVIDVPRASAEVCDDLVATFKRWHGAQQLPWNGYPEGEHHFVTTDLRSGKACSMRGRSPQGWSIGFSAWVPHVDTAPDFPTEFDHIPAGTTRVIVEVSPPT